MSSSRILPRLIIILGCAFIGASIGTTLQVLRITKKEPEFRSLAKIVAGGQMVFHDTIQWREQQADFYGTIIETIESAEMSHRALERVKALNPDLEVSEVDIRVVQTKGSTIFNILATGAEPKYTRIFLDALLDEFIAFRQSIREQAQGKVLQQFLQEVVTKQKIMEEAQARMEQARSKVGTLEAKAEQERLAARLIRLRDQRDDLRLQIKTPAAAEAARAPLVAKLGPIEQEIQTIEAGLQQYETAAAELQHADQSYQKAQMAYEKLFEAVEQFQTVFNSGSDYTAIQERASPAFENVEDWKQPIAVGAGAGGLLGGLIGLLLSLIIVRSPSESLK